MKATASGLRAQSEATLESRGPPSRKSVAAARKRARAAKEQVRLAKDRLKDARKHLKEVKRKAKQLRKRAQAECEAWQEAKAEKAKAEKAAKERLVGQRKASRGSRPVTRERSASPIRTEASKRQRASPANQPQAAPLADTAVATQTAVSQIEPADAAVVSGLEVPRPTDL